MKRIENTVPVLPVRDWIGIEDASLYSELAGAGVTIVQAPTQQPWAYEMKIADPDGNTLWLGAEPTVD